MKPITWGTFTPCHLISLAVVPLFGVLLFLLLRKRRALTQRIVLFLLSLVGPAAIVYNLVMWHSPLEYLPLHLCSFSALLIPFFLLTKNQTVGNALPVFALGALCALLLNHGMAMVDVPSWVFFFFYVPHMMEFLIPLLALSFGLIQTKKRYVFTTMLFFFVFYTMDFFVNLALNRYFVAADLRDWSGALLRVNYMFSISPDGNPVLEFLWKLIPHQYVYLLPLFPVILGISALFSLIGAKIRKR